MTVLNLSVDELLTTTRTVRKRLDFSRSVDINVIKECLEVALQAPTASNSQNWHFVIVTDFDKKQKIAELYRRAWDTYLTMPVAAPKLHQGDPVLGPVRRLLPANLGFDISPIIVIILLYFAQSFIARTIVDLGIRLR